MSVIIPSFGRPHDLLRCLAAVSRQTRQPDEVLVALRADQSAGTVLSDLAVLAINLQTVDVGDADASYARNQALDRSTGDILVFTDDDTVPYPDWLARIHAAFDEDPALGAVGGPDWIGGVETALGHRPRRIGMVQWWGRCIGNHHCGAPARQRVEWLKGANMAFRREALRPASPFGRYLLGDAAQYGEDMAVSLEVKSAGWGILYDPGIQVAHYPGMLASGADHRGLRDRASLIAASHNETRILADYLSPLRKTAFLLWSLVIGTRLMPGIGVALYRMLSGGRFDGLQNCWTVAQGRWAGWRTWRRMRTSEGSSRSSIVNSAPLVGTATIGVAPGDRVYPNGLLGRKCS